MDNTKPYVLIVEDNHINALVLTKVLEPYCKADHVINDEGAFTAVEDKSYTIIFMDINLGGNSLDGEEIMKRLKDNPKHAHIPIFAVTSYAMPGDKDRFLSAGFDNYFPKPISRVDIVEIVEKTLRQVNA